MKKHFHIHIKAHVGILARAGKDPYADWLIILLVSTVAAIVFIFFSVSLFLRIDNGDTAAMADVKGSTVDGTLDQPDLVKLIADFQEKKSRTAQFDSGYHGVADPSGTTAPAGLVASTSSTSSGGSHAAAAPATLEN